MKLTKTLVVVGLLAFGGTAANASTLGWMSSWSSSSSYSYSSQASSQRVYSIASTLFSRYTSNDHFRQNANRVVASVLSRVQERLAERVRPEPASNVSDVPIPASGLLLVGALGALALRRRQKG